MCVLNCFLLLIAPEISKVLPQADHLASSLLPSKDRPSHLEIAARSIDGCHHPSYFWTCILNFYFPTLHVTRYMFCLMTFAAHQSSFRTLKIWEVYFYSSSQHLNAILMSLKYPGLHFPSISLFNKGKPPNMSLNFQEFPANVTCFA